MSVFQTLKQRNANVTKTIVNTLHQYIKIKVAVHGFLIIDFVTY